MISEADHPTEAEKTLRDTYSNYSLAIKCDIFNLVGNTNTAIRAQTGCCLRDMDTTKGGGYCMLINSAEDGIDTYYLTDAQFGTVRTDPFVFSTLSTVTDGYTGFTKFYQQIGDGSTDDLGGVMCTSGSTLKDCWVGYKLQPWPAADYDGAWRFEGQSFVMGSMYNALASGSEKWIDNTFTLTNAMNKFTLASTASTLSFLAYGLF